MKRVFIVHGWNSKPKDAWFPWLKKKLEENKFSVSTPAMPTPVLPKMERWLATLTETIGTPDEECYFVGHSLGCITILRYLEIENRKIGGAVLVSGFAESMGYPMVKTFFETPILWNRIKKNCDRFVSIHSDNDKIVNIKYGDYVARTLGAELLTSHRGHYSGIEGVKDAPEILEALLKLTVD